MTTTLSWRLWVFLGVLSGFLSVSIGAFGAHALKPFLDPSSLQTFETAARYQFYHALALILLGLYSERTDSKKSYLITGLGFSLGTLLFSGSLYALSISGIKELGLITPIGGVLFLIGWLFWIKNILQQKS